MATRALSKFQYGKEVISTHGTAVAATKILAGAQIKSVAPDRKPAFIPDALGVKARSTRSEIYELRAAGHGDDIHRRAIFTDDDDDECQAGAAVQGCDVGRQSHDRTHRRSAGI